jgi:hypothetical protein
LIYPLKIVIYGDFIGLFILKPSMCGNLRHMTSLRQNFIKGSIPDVSPAVLAKAGATFQKSG